MTADEYAKNIEACINELEEKVPDFILTFGVSLSSQIRERIQLRGEGKDGAFKKYTKKYDAYKTKKEKNQGFRDLTFSGDLMKEFIRITKITNWVLKQIYQKQKQRGIPNLQT